MSKIKMLSENVCNKIAAGEVVERPASVVKELIENSLDAGAGKLSVSVEKAGSKLIRIADDGEGMDEDDALLCFETHATSKITSEEDIYSISSFGFRGEALPSIAAVSRMSMRTRRRESPGGVEVVMQGGKMIAENPAGCAPGTEVTVRDLFYNVPARRKFLKSPATEERHILDCITNISLAHPETAFEVKIDGRIFLSSPASSSLLPRIRELFGKEFADALLPVSKTENGISVTGFISKRSYTKASRSDQRIFVNGRPIESQSVYRGIREGFGPMLERGRYPAAIIFLHMDPGFVDVNVHPAKREVRFRNDFEVIAAVRSAVTSALRTGDQVIPAPGKHPSGEGEKQNTLHALYSDFAPSENESTGLEDREGKKEVPVDCGRSLCPDASSSGIQEDSGKTVVLSGLHDMAETVVSEKSHGVTELGRIMRSAHVEYRVSGAVEQESLLRSGMESPALLSASARTEGDGRKANEGQQEEFSAVAELKANVECLKGNENSVPERFCLEREDSSDPVLGDRSFRILGLMENSYIVGTVDGGLVLIDQHAAHERVLYEKILKGVDGSMSQRLLLPLTLEISRADMLFVSRNLESFEKVGFELEPFGKNTLKLNGIPAVLPQNDAGGMFLDMLSRIAENGSSQTAVLDRIARAACKAAVKAHDRLTLEECEALIRQLGHCELPFSCPHGRPTVLNISLGEIERRFGRK